MTHIQLHCHRPENGGARRCQDHRGECCSSEGPRTTSPSALRPPRRLAAEELACSGFGCLWLPFGCLLAAFRCLSLPFAAFRCLSLPFAAFRCLSLPSASSAASRPACLASRSPRRLARPAGFAPARLLDGARSVGKDLPAPPTGETDRGRGPGGCWL